MPLALVTSVIWLFQNSAGSNSPANKVPSVAAATVQPVGPAPQGAATTPAPLQNDNYSLGPGDQIFVKALDFDEIDNKPVVVDSRGYIDLPELGRIQVAGLTSDQIEGILEERLGKYLQHPEVTVTVGEIHSQRVSVLGSVVSPGVHTLQGNPTLFEVLSSVGGLRGDAGYTVLITRQLSAGPIPLPDSHLDAAGQFYVASVSITSIMRAINPEENIHVKANDVITVPKGEVIYVIGAVHKAGGFLLNEHQSLSALQIVSLAEGLDRTAAGQRAKIMRPIPGKEDRQEIPIDIKKILAGKIPDVPLKADDILFVPVSVGKAAGYRTIDVAAGAATAFIYRIP